MTDKAVHHIKCTIHEEAPIFESFIYLIGEKDSLDTYLQENNPALIEPAQESVVDIARQIIETKGLRLVSAEDMCEQSYELDLDATRADGLPYIVINVNESPVNYARIS